MGGNIVGIAHYKHTSKCHFVLCKHKILSTKIFKSNLDIFCILSSMYLFFHFLHNVFHWVKDYINRIEFNNTILWVIHLVLSIQVITKSNGRDIFFSNIFWMIYGFIHWTKTIFLSVFTKAEDDINLGTSASMPWVPRLQALATPASWASGCWILGFRYAPD